ncbi:hypothetical protein CVT24_006414 [Panaeolus cyanescens]|uniref:Uncharacterized protein n=1 Tax=Panaeolus cyanescens TaxID=181874 RepID=A0A409X3A2_9AGAR|nr:hypothetical protein CVT24_006414 [Panaeolus cyanescens]
MRDSEPNEPIFPPELERKIFEMVYDGNDPVNRSSDNHINLVAKRVYIWIRPLMYRIINQHSASHPNFSRIPAFLDADDICQFVHHLAISNAPKTEADVNAFISQCPNLVNLACWGDLIITEAPLWDYISGLKKLRRLSDREITGDVRQVYSNDCRIAIVHYSLSDSDDWFRGARGERDVWWHAETLVTARKNNYLQSDDILKHPLTKDVVWPELLTEEGKR